MVAFLEHISCQQQNVTTRVGIDKWDIFSIDEYQAIHYLVRNKYSNINRLVVIRNLSDIFSIFYALIKPLIERSANEL